MTIINPVISVGGGGDTVSAYALGSAKGLQEGDKVLLNYSADWMQKEAIYTPISAYRIRQVACYKDFVYTLDWRSAYTAYIRSYKRNLDGSFKRIEEIAVDGNRAYGDTPIDVLGDGFLVTGNARYTTPGSGTLVYKINKDTGRLTQLSIPTDIGLCHMALSDDGKLLKKGQCLISSEYGEWVGSESTITGMNILPGGEHPIYYGVYSGNTNVCRIDLLNRTITENVGTLSGFSPVSQTGCGVVKDGFYFVQRAGTLFVYTYEKDGENYTFTEQASMQNSLRECVARYGYVGTKSSGYPLQVYFKSFGDDIIVRNALNIYADSSYFRGSIRLRINKEKGIVEEVPSMFIDKTADPSNVAYYEDPKICVYASGGFGSPSVTFTFRTMSVPLEEPFIANTSTSPLSFYPAQTLTGFVKSNDNGVLEVSTVVDPNAVVPTPPDEYGLDVKVNYGGNVILEPNGTVVGASVSDEGVLTTTSVSSNIGMYFDNPIYNKAYNSFEIVVPFKSTYTSTQHLIDFDTDALMVYSNNYNKLYLRTRTVSDSSLTDTAANGIDLSTKTWLKLSYSSSVGYTLSYSKDGSDWTTAVTVSKTGVPNSIRQTTNFTNNVANIYLADAYMVVDGVRVWEGTKSRVEFGSVGISYGYFRNTLSKPSDKYVEYGGGSLGKEDVLSMGGYVLNPAVYRNADLGQWVSDTKGALLGETSHIAGTVKRLEPTVYLWHDYSHITPVKPETLEPVVDLDANTVSLPVSWKHIDNVLYEYPNGFPVTQARELSANIVEGANNLYTTKTGDDCGLSISSTSPAGVDSSAVIGTVELDANGSITSYTPK